MTDTARASIGLIGLGKMGLSHLAIANATKGLQVASICDSSRPLVSALKKNTCIPGYTCHKKMLAAHDLDGVIISVPNAYHFSVAIECLENGISVFIEKPLTLSYAQSQKLVVQAENNGLFGQVGFVNRFNPMFSHAKSLISNGIIGTLETYKSSMMGGVVLKSNSKGWRNSYLHGGGCLYDYGPHCLDLARYLVGGGALVATASLERIFSTAVDDSVCAQLTYKSGLSGELSVNWSDPTFRKAENLFEVTGTKGTMVINKQEIHLTLIEGSSDGRFSAGLEKIFITDLDTSVDFYLRGEDFSRQMSHFAALCNGSDSENVSCLSNAAETDKLIGDIFERAGVRF